MTFYETVKIEYKNALDKLQNQLEEKIEFLDFLWYDVFWLKKGISYHPQLNFKPVSFSKKEPKSSFWSLLGPMMSTEISGPGLGFFVALLREPIIAHKQDWCFISC